MDITIEHIHPSGDLRLSTIKDGQLVHCRYSGYSEGAAKKAFRQEHSTPAERAAQYYLEHQGMSGTAKQVAKFMKQFPAETIIRMATERGFTA